MAVEYRRRLHEAHDSRPSQKRSRDWIGSSRPWRGIGRLIDSYAAGVIDRPEFEPRVAGIKPGVAKLEPSSVRP